MTLRRFKLHPKDEDLFIFFVAWPLSTILLLVIVAALNYFGAFTPQGGTP